MSALWDAAYLFGLVLVFPVLLYRVMTQGKYRSGLRERLGGAPRRMGDKPCLWVHAVSVGEVVASRTLISGFRRRHGDWDVVVSTTTDTGYAAAGKTYPDCLVIRNPLDFSGAIRRSLSRIRPSLIVLMELELWPNFIRLARERGIPVVIANGRLSARSHRLQRRVPFLLSRSYARISRLCVQTWEYARRFKDVGALPNRITVTGSLKYDAVVCDVPDDDELREQLGVAESEKLIVAGSTTDAEEEILLEVYRRLKKDRADVRLAIVPRHPERFDAVAELIRTRGFSCLRRSAPDTEVTDDDPVILGDTMGELVRFYAAAEIVFVGKSLVAPGGGQNVMEPAALGKPVLFGPFMSNFQETRDRLLASDAALEVTDVEAIVSAAVRLLDAPDAAREMGKRARSVIENARGATERTLDILEDVLASDAQMR